MNLVTELDNENPDKVIEPWLVPVQPEVAVNVLLVAPLAADQALVVFAPDDAPAVVGT